MRSFLLSRWLRSLLGPRGKTFVKKSLRPLSLETLEDRITPSTFTWTGAGTDANWSTAANWAGNSAPTGSALTLDNLVFGPGAKSLISNDDLLAATFNSISFTSSNYQITASPDAVLTLGNSQAPTGTITVNAGFTGESLGMNIVLGGNKTASGQTFSVGLGGSLTLLGQLSGSTGPDLTLTGGGTLTLSGDNSAMTGPISITNTTMVQITSPTALGAPSLAKDVTTVAANSQLQVNNVTGTISEGLVLYGNGPGGTGALLEVAGANTWGGNIQLNSGTTFGATAGSLDIQGVISGQGNQNVTIVGSNGEIIFANNDTYNGSTTINGGILDIQQPNSLGTGLATSPTQTTTVNSNSSGSGTLQLEDPNGVGFTVSKELLILNGPGNSNALGALDSINGANIWANNVILGSASPNGSAVTIAVAAPNSDIAGDLSSLTISGVQGAAAGTPAITSPNSGGPYNLTKQDQGTLTLTTPNTFTGAVTVAAGILCIEDSNALGTGTSGTTVDAGASLELSVDNKTTPDSVTGTMNSLQLSEPLTITGTGSGLGALYSHSGINTWTTPITLAGSENAIGVDPAANPTGLPYNYDITGTGKVLDNSLTFTSSNLLVGAGQLDKVDAGQLILPYANTTFTGNTDIQAGWVTIENSQGLGGLIPGEGQTAQPTITVASGASLHLLPLTGNLNLTQNFKLAGSGITDPAYPLIDNTNPKNGGALVNLAGINTIGGNVQLNGAFPPLPVTLPTITASSL
jgi:fibronectin-binding autotransporter adhesin